MRRLPVTPIPRTLLDLAGVVDFKLLRRALAEAHHRKLLDLAAVRRECGHGKRGSNALRRALAIHLPELAQAENDFEAEFLFLIELAGLPIPELNAYVEGLKVDAMARRQARRRARRATRPRPDPVANEEDRRRELILRRAAYRVIRYTWRQVTREPRAVVDDLRSHLGG